MASAKYRNGWPTGPMSMDGWRRITLPRSCTATATWTELGELKDLAVLVENLGPGQVLFGLDGLELPGDGVLPAGSTARLVFDRPVATTTLRLAAPLGETAVRVKVTGHRPPPPRLTRGIVKTPIRDKNGVIVQVLEAPAWVPAP